MIQSIALPTTFDEHSEQAFRHALALALVKKARLYLLHVRAEDKGKNWQKFPSVRDVLQEWGILPQGAEIADIQAKTGVEVRKVDIVDDDPGRGLVRFFEEHHPGLIVMATQGKMGLVRTLFGSVSGELTTRAQIPVLQFGPGARGFIDPASGKVLIRTIAAPVDCHPIAGPALAHMRAIFDDTDIKWNVFHVGKIAPSVPMSGPSGGKVSLLSGNVIDVIVEQGKRADLVGIPTVGREGFLDAIRGSTTERVVHDADCPVLAVFSG